MPSQNPAVLGTILQDKIYLIWSTSQNNIGGGRIYPKDVGNGYKLDEAGNVVERMGYEYPLGQRWGINVEFIFSNVDAKLEAPYDFYDGGGYGVSGPIHYFHPLTIHYGLALDVGYAFNEWLSLGLSETFYYTDARREGGINIDLRKGFDASFGAGFLLTLLNKQLYIDTFYTFTKEQEYYLPSYTSSTPQEDSTVLLAHYPSVLESTVTGVSFERRLFLVLKQITDFYTSAGAGSKEYDRSGIASRIIPSIEVWPFYWLSLRGVFIYLHTNLMEQTNSGKGAIASITLRFSTRDFDVNYTVMERASRLVPKYETSGKRFLFQFSKNATFFIS